MSRLSKYLVGLVAVISFSNASAQVPDTAINQEIKLRNSAESYVLATTPIKNDSAFRVYVFSNRPKTEYLLMHKFPGDSKGIMSRFEVGLTRSANFEIRSATQLEFDYFRTESGIELGMDKVTIVSLKGTGYTTKKEKGGMTLTYRWSDINSDFLRKYNMPGYTETFVFANDKLVKFFFGFDSE